MDDEILKRPKSLHRATGKEDTDLYNPFPHGDVQNLCEFCLTGFISIFGENFSKDNNVIFLCKHS